MSINYVYYYNTIQICMCTCMCVCVCVCLCPLSFFSTTISLLLLFTGHSLITLICYPLLIFTPITDLSER